jgi:hypothetical protein
MFLTFLSFPGFLSNIGLAGSHSEGMLFSVIPLTLVILASGRWMPISKYQFNISLSIFAIILLHFLLVVLMGSFNNSIFFIALNRFILSFVLFMVILWSAFQFVRYFSSLEQSEFCKMINTIYWLFVVIAFLSIPFHFFDWVSRKQMLIFSEPSHFSIIFSSFFLFKMFTSKHRYKHLLICLSLVILLQNVTLLAIACLGLIISVKNYNIFRILGIFLLLSTFVFFTLLFSNYFSFIIERLSISSKSDNLSVLIFLSGYERAYLTLLDSYFVGVGFQQMGIIGPLGEFQKIIMQITMDGTMNTMDGGTLFSKLVTEFGILGIIVILAYVIKFIGVFGVRNILLPGDFKMIFYSVSFLSCAVLIFVRAVNYFSPSTFLFLIALIGLSKFNIFTNSKKINS